MTRETKAGLLMIVMLVGVFGFMVYKRMHQPATAMAQQNPESEQQPPAELPNDPAEPADPFLSHADDFANSSKIIRAAEDIPADETPRRASAVRPVRRAEARDADPFDQVEITSDQVEITSDQAKITSRPSKPKLPTAIPDDFVDRAPKGPSSRTTAATLPISVPDALPKSRAGDFHSFDGMETQTSPSKSQGRHVARTVTTAANRADSFDEDRKSGFGRPVNVVSARDDQSQPEFADATDQPAQSDNRSPSFDRPVEVNSQRQDFADPFEAPSQKSTPVPVQVSEPSANDPFDLPAKPAAVPPRNNRVASEDQFGGYRPAAANDGATNEFRGDDRPIQSQARDAAPRRVARPAPVTQIDEDFGAKSSARPLVAGDNYQIEPSDNFWTISRKKYGTGRYFMALAQHNVQVITDPKRMKPGVIIATPSAESLERAYPQLIPKPATVDPVQTASVAQSTFVTAAATEGDAGYFVSNEGTPMYRVGKEDTLSGVAQRHLGRSSRWVQVYEMNRDVLTDGNTLKIGAVLRLPSDASRVDVVAGGRTLR